MHIDVTQHIGAVTREVSRRTMGNAGGEILVCEPPRHLKITWEFAGQVSWLEVRVARHGPVSRLRLEHSMVVDDHWKKFGAGAWGAAAIAAGENADAANAAVQQTTAAYTGS